MGSVSSSSTKIVVVERRWGMDTHSCDNRLGLAKLGMSLATFDIELGREEREVVFRQLQEHLTGLYEAFKEET